MFIPRGPVKWESKYLFREFQQAQSHSEERGPQTSLSPSTSITGAWTSGDNDLKCPFHFDSPRPAKFSHSKLVGRLLFLRIPLITLKTSCFQNPLSFLTLLMYHKRKEKGTSQCGISSVEGSSCPLGGGRRGTGSLAAQPEPSRVACIGLSRGRGEPLALLQTFPTM